MNISTGVDLIEIERISNAVMRNGDHFISRIYTETEQSDCLGSYASLAVRFAAKEAVSKALGCGIGDVRWLDIEIISNKNRQPTVRLHGNARLIADHLGLSTWSVSLSHTHSHAIAFVVASGSEAIDT